MGLLLQSPHLRAGDEWGGLAAKLFANGIEMEETAVPMRSPIADPLADEVERAEGAKQLAGARGWSQFTRKSSVAPVHIDLDYVKDSQGERIGIRAHFAFVAHANVDTLRDNDVMKKLFATAGDESADEGTETDAISDEALAARGIEPDESVSYSQLQTVLLKKVALNGVMATERVDGPDHFAFARTLDERFSSSDVDSDKLSNTWARIERDEVGKPVQTEPRPYAGAAGYLVVSRVPGDEEASLLEGEVLLHEPDGWFSGSNLLRSKLPLIIQEGARKLRRGLKK